MSITPEQARIAADALLASRTAEGRIEALPEGAQPATPDDGYVIQKLLVEGMIAAGRGHSIGYKVGCTNQAARVQLGVESCFHGVMLSGHVHENGAVVSHDDYKMMAIEPEVAVRLGKDLPDRGTPYTKDDLTDAIAAVLPVIEVVDSQFTDWTTIGGPSIVADNAAHGGWIRGTEITDWRGIDLNKVTTNLSFGDTFIGTGEASLVEGGSPDQRGPLAVTTWLANALIEQGSSLKAGQVVSTGTLLAPDNAKRGDLVTANFGDFGQVEFTIG